MTTRSGFAIIEGTIEQIDELRHSEDYRVNFNRVINVCNHINATTLETGDAMMTRMQRYGKVLKELG